MTDPHSAETVGTQHDTHTPAPPPPVTAPKAPPPPLMGRAPRPGAIRIRKPVVQGAV